MSGLFGGTRAQWRPGDQAPVVIGAVGGSGTRVLACMLRDAGFFIGRDLNKALDSVPGTAFVRHWIPKVLADDDLSGFAEGLARTFSTHRMGIPDAQGLWAVKNPRWAFLVAQLADHVPDLRFVHLVRDGRDMAFSGNQNQLRDYGSFLVPPALRDAPHAVHSAAQWSAINAQVAQIGADLGPANYLRIRFEDLCSDPRSTARELLTFAGTPGADVEVVALVRAPSSIGRWREQDEGLIEQVAQAADVGLRTLGYT